MKIDIVDYLDSSPLAECLILRLEYDRSARVVEIEYDYAAEAISRAFKGHSGLAVADWRKLSLGGVTSFEVAPTIGGSSDAAIAEFQDRLTQRPATVTGAGAETSGTRQLLQLHFSGGFTIAIECATADVEMRRAQPVADGHGSWKYIDVETGVEVDSRFPFAAK